MPTEAERMMIDSSLGALSLVNLRIQVRQGIWSQAMLDEYIEDFISSSDRNTNAMCMSSTFYMLLSRLEAEGTSAMSDFHTMTSRSGYPSLWSKIIETIEYSVVRGIDLGKMAPALTQITTSYEDWYTVERINEALVVMSTLFKYAEDNIEGWDTQSTLQHISNCIIADK